VDTRFGGINHLLFDKIVMEHTEEQLACWPLLPSPTLLTNAVLCAQSFAFGMGFWAACMGFGIPYPLAWSDPLSMSEIEVQGLGPLTPRKKSNGT